MSWYRSLPPAETSVPCGGVTHSIRWEEGRLALSDHPDPEAELVLAALGGDKPVCLSLAETWARHADDLAVLSAGPRTATDRVTITREQIDEEPDRLRQPAAPRPPSTGAPLSARRDKAKTVTVAGAKPVSPRRYLATAEKTDKELARRARNRVELLELMALGPEFQFRLSGAVAAAWADPERAGERAARRPELAAALTGRFAPVAAEWLGIDPDAVSVTPHEGPGWGSLAVAGDGRLTGALPVSWLADVWACGLALSGGRLIVSVTEPGYPRARALALPEPGAVPIPLAAGR